MGSFSLTAGSKPLPSRKITILTHQLYAPLGEGIVHAKDYGNT